MPLVYINTVAPKVFLGLWKINETFDDFNLLTKKKRIANLISHYGSTKRKLEVLSAHALLHIMADNESLTISHTNSGRPIVEGWNISISHTCGFVAILLSESCKVAIDIEYYNDRINRIIHKFLRDDEYAETLNSRIIHWCAKETLYKFLSEQNLKYTEIRINNLSIPPNGIAMTENLRDGTVHKINYEIRKEYILTFLF